MKYIVYISSASHLMNSDELLDILQVSRQNNTQRGLTGMLLYSEGTFIQLLEGDEEGLRLTYDSIENDGRHKNIIKMVEGKNEQRIFPEWSMGFKSASAAELQEFQGYIDPNRPEFLKNIGSAPIIHLLKTFADTNRM